jgi:hypothetical protein
MSTLPSASSRAAYRIRIAGRVADGWDDFMSRWEESFISEQGDTLTVVTGLFADQAALFGMLCRVRDRGLVLVSVEHLPWTDPGRGAGQARLDRPHNPGDPRLRNAAAKTEDEP